MPYQPPFRLTNELMTQVAKIAELVGRWNATHQAQSVPALRRGNRIKTIQASLAVEQNSLSLEQVTAVFEGKAVLGPPREIQEVRNAFKAYEAMQTWRAHSLGDLFSAHALLMTGLVDDAGQLRRGGSGIYQGKQLVHMAPPASQLKRLMDDLFGWLEQTDAHPLISSAAFHYDFEFIHPFTDGNGRMGRLWQTLILSQWQPMLAYLPVETVIKHRQNEYYRLLGEADAQSDCTLFISFLLKAIEDSLREAIAQEPNSQEKGSEKSSEKSSEKILTIIKENPHISARSIAEQLGLSSRAVEKQIARLKTNGLLSRIGAPKGGHWEVPE